MHSSLLKAYFRDHDGTKQEADDSPLPVTMYEPKTVRVPYILFESYEDIYSLGF